MHVRPCVSRFEAKDFTLAADAPVVFVLPGVVGRGTNVYVRHMASYFMRSFGWRVVAKSWRGIGAPLTTPRY
ncbi:unnamed protein product [Discosporangium mesarthrocarpum]